MFDYALKVCGDVGTRDDQAQWEIGCSRNRFQNRGQTFHAPVVADEQEHEFVVGKFSPKASTLTPRQAGRDRKLDSVDAVGDYSYILASEASVEQTSSAVGDRCESCFSIAVDDAFEGGDRCVVRAAVKPARCAAPGFRHEWLLRLFLSQLAQPAKHRVHNDEIGIETIDAGR